MGITATGRRFCDAHVYSSAAGALTRGATCKLPPKVKSDGRDLCHLHDPKAVKARREKHIEKVDAWMDRQNAAFEAHKREQRRRERLDKLLPAVIKHLTTVQPDETEDSHDRDAVQLAEKLRRCLP